MKTQAFSTVAVLGSYRGGTSVVTGLLNQFGYFVGDAFFHAWNGYGTYEDLHLRRICLECFDEREGHWKLLGETEFRIDRLARWKIWAQWRATETGAIGIAGKHPSMCKFGETLRVGSCLGFGVDGLLIVGENVCFGIS
ncbi:hypothetical protein Poly51_48320 [Rubripirellula tenax]|uniref:Sulfotransferase family protein n=1 Tax=Rubripirellula tenax TaxID=2528015 RepID=A0A5C6EJC2_9BACT|nr:hypothetical protein [Rubripirellula tenax]TWU48928.1 hypothetical protein Poly51_48320 [Rubripirellula tenax]